MELIPFLPVEYAGREIVATAFGSTPYSVNLMAMQRIFKDKIFTPLPTNKSLAVACCNFADIAKPKILEPDWLQAGLVLKVSDGLWINPLMDSKGEIIMDQNKLNKHLIPERKVNGIYLLDGDTSFVSYDSFEQGKQEPGKFLESGLARGLVNTAGKKAGILSLIANNRESQEVVVSAFNLHKEPIVINGPNLAVVSLRLHYQGRVLSIYGGYGPYNGPGYALGELVSTKKS